MTKRQSTVANLLILAGLSASFYGLWLAWPPLAWISIGLAVLYFGILVARLKEYENDR